MSVAVITGASAGLGKAYVETVMTVFAWVMDKGHDLSYKMDEWKGKKPEAAPQKA